MQLGNEGITVHLVKIANPICSLCPLPKDFTILQKISIFTSIKTTLVTQDLLMQKTAQAFLKC